MAGVKGLEPSAFCVTGRRYNQLNYTPAYCEIEYKWNWLQRQEKKIDFLKKYALFYDVKVQNYFN